MQHAVILLNLSNAIRIESSCIDSRCGTIFSVTPTTRRTCPVGVKIIIAVKAGFTVITAQNVPKKTLSPAENPRVKPGGEKSGGSRARHDRSESLRFGSVRT